jgi:hypothetical protein
MSQQYQVVTPRRKKFITEDFYSVNVCSMTKEIIRDITTTLTLAKITESTLGP